MRWPKLLISSARESLKSTKLIHKDLITCSSNRGCPLTFIFTYTQTGDIFSYLWRFFLLSLTLYLDRSGFLQLYPKFKLFCLPLIFSFRIQVFHTPPVIIFCYFLWDLDDQIIFVSPRLVLVGTLSNLVAPDSFLRHIVSVSCSFLLCALVSVQLSMLNLRVGLNVVTLIFYCTKYITSFNYLTTKNETTAKRVKYKCFSHQNSSKSNGSVKKSIKFAFITYFFILNIVVIATATTKMYSRSSSSLRRNVHFDLVH